MSVDFMLSMTGCQTVYFWFCFISKSLLLPSGRRNCAFISYFCSVCTFDDWLYCIYYFIQWNLHLQWCLCDAMLAWLLKLCL